MADNYLERQYEDYQQRKTEQARAKRLQWQKQLKAYKAKLAAERVNRGSGE